MNFIEAVGDWKSNDEWRYADKEAAWKFFFAAGKESSQTVISAQCVKMSQYESIIFELRKQLAAAQEENARLKAESRDACLGLNDYYGRKLAAAQEECEFQRNAHKQAEELMLGQSNQLAAEQLNNKRLRGALEAVIKVHRYESGIPVEALATPASTEALDKYVAEKVKDVQLQDVEHK